LGRFRGVSESSLTGGAICGGYETGTALRTDLHRSAPGAATIAVDDRQDADSDRWLGRRIAYATGVLRAGLPSVLSVVVWFTGLGLGAIVLKLVHAGLAWARLKS
jgi:hypothetical protein